MEKRIAMITGSTSGIGKETARELSRQGFKVIMACRNKLKAESVRKELASDTGNNDFEIIMVDMASLDSIRTFATESLNKFDRVDILINNAGVFQPKRTMTVDGFETTFAVNHLAPFLVTSLLLPLLRNGGESRIVNLGSDSHYYGKLRMDDLMFDKRRYSGFKAYAASRLATIFFTQELAARLAGDEIVANCAHPGHIATNIWDFGDDASPLDRIAGKIQERMADSPQNGARTSVLLAVSDKFSGVSGLYLTPKGPKEPSKVCRKHDIQTELWTTTAKMVGSDLIPQAPLSD